jgi:hypothetical protein
LKAYNVNFKYTYQSDEKAQMLIAAENEEAAKQGALDYLKSAPTVTDPEITSVETASDLQKRYADNPTLN